MADEQRLHIAALPCDGSGHINPMLELCRRLVPLGFHVSFVLPRNLCSKVESSLREDDLHIDLVPSPPTDVSLIRAAELQEEVKAVLEALRPPVKCLISDFFLGWSQDVAASLGIPQIALNTSHAINEVLFYHIPELESRGYIPASGNPDHQTLIDFIPGLEPFPRRLLPLGFQRGGPVVLLLGAAAKRTKEAACVLVNSIEELDHELVTSRRKEFPNYLPVGPLVPPALLQEHETISSPEEDTSISWLDKQPHRSVLYIAFGSVISLPADQVEKIAKAVQATHQPVLWAIRRNFASDAPENFFESLQEKVGEHSLVVEWAPQVPVLRQSAVGAFLTHCGWNSVLEALLCGVPTLCWPCAYEQNSNAHVMTEKWKTGVKLADGPDDGVKCEDLEKIIDAVMNGEEGKTMRRRAEALKEIVRKSTGLERNIRQLKNVIVAASQ
ncbi:anthocyanidin 3-O-glucosyltransferase 7 [Selaginella moellendorffii]|uniref:anthocyanidin 3-O-glucosyltransferase 7 n=1 Tax=Selaginella moellendorffii TaxID=88036 RepID=UPI000D1CC73D|nr:anthocyanidin 3-O-glucosyltransferase 7 [Selaginella moellendorffii]|eukprot:XP_024526233.1 anthocyanidin 3-O-glucosyltransferase 7 [Selaginella moellendorffii]